MTNYTHTISFLNSIKIKGCDGPTKYDDEINEVLVYFKKQQLENEANKKKMKGLLKQLFCGLTC